MVDEASCVSVGRPSDRPTSGGDAWHAKSPEEKHLRELLFRAHINSEHFLYGDDGVMQCNSCGCDFKVDSAQTLSDKMYAFYLQKLAREQVSLAHGDAAR